MRITLIFYIFIMIILGSLILTRIMRISKTLETYHNGGEKTIRFTISSGVYQNISRRWVITPFLEIVFPEKIQANIGDTIIVRGVVSRTDHGLTDIFNNRIRLTVGSYYILNSNETSGIVFVRRIHELYTNLHEEIRTIFVSFLPSPTSDVILAIVLGREYDFPQDLQRELRDLGFGFLVSMSGYHVTLFISFFQDKLRIKGRNIISFSLYIALLLSFLMITRFPPLYVRTAGMAIWRLFSRVIKQEYSRIWSFLVITGLIFLWNPPLLFSVGFQFSSLALCFTAWLYPICRRLCCNFSSGNLGFIRSLFVKIMVLMLGIVPLQLLFFQRITLWGVIAYPLLFGYIQTLFTLALGMLVMYKIPLLIDITSFLLKESTQILLTTLQITSRLPSFELETKDYHSFIISFWIGCLAFIFWKDKNMRQKYRYIKEKIHF